ncbi:MAG: AAA family ATPase [Halieaceae bacterium]
MSARHRDALAHLLYGVGAGGGFILLTGEVGTGKTTINRCLLEQLPADTDIAIILNPALNADELLATVCDELGIAYDASAATLKDLTDKLHSFLLENHAQGRNTVLLIDEAQHLQFDVLEQIRLLTNLETNTRKLLQIILVGQPELGSMLAKPELRQLSQRITARYNLAPLNRAETDAYIRHRLQVAGLPANQELFPAAIVSAVFKHTRGIPRLINVLCDRSLLGSYGQNQSKVSMKMLRQAVREVMGEDSERPAGGRWMWGLAAVLVLAVGISLASRYLPGNISPAPASEPELVREEVAPAAMPAGPSAVLMRNRQAALAALSSYMGVAVDPAMNVCDQLQQGNWQCEFLRAASWNDLLEFGRPVVLTLVTPSRFISYAVLIGIESEIGLVLHEGVQHRVPLTELGPMWRGEFQLFWQPPVDYAGPISLGARGPMVAWLAREFARLDEQSQPLAEDEFNAALEARVRLFQRQFNLLDDGVVGLKTLLRLNAARGLGVPLMGSTAEFASLGQG